MASSKRDAFLQENAFQQLPTLLRVSSEDARYKARAKRFLQALLLLLVLGLISGLIAYFGGHHVMGTTVKLTWGVLISAYIYFALSCSGLCMVSSLGHVFGIKRFVPIARQATFLALMLLVIGFGVIATEIEKPLTLALFAVISPHFTAPIWWMGALYGGYVFVLAAEFYFLMVEDHKRARYAGITAVVVAIAASSNLGSVFGLLHARPYWYGPFVPLYFVATALLSGAAILILVVYFTDYFENDKVIKKENEQLIHTLAKLLALFLGLVMFLTIWKSITGLVGGYKPQSDITLAFLLKHMFLSFWGFEVLLGLVIPFAILVSSYRKQLKHVVGAAIMPLIGLFVARFNFVYAGQMSPLKPTHIDATTRIHYTPAYKGTATPFLSYTPSWVEIMIVVGALAAAIIGYTAATRVLKLQQPATEEGAGHE